MRLGRRGIVLASVVAGLGCGLSSQAQAPPRRVVYVTFDAGADWIVDRLLAEGKAPAFTAAAAEGAHADALITTIPTLTAVAHATLWTGTTPRHHGIAGNAVARLPRSAHTLLESESGFARDPLTAEPIWITAARAGRRVLVAQATQGYPFSGQFPDRLLQFDVYNSRLAGEGWIEGALEQGTHRFTIGETVFQLRRAPAGSALEVSGLSGPEAGSTGRGPVTLRAGLAGSFSPPLPVSVKGRRAAVRMRLVAFDPRTSAFRLFHGEVMEVTSTHPEKLAAFQRAAGALIGERVVDDYLQGRFGPTLAAGGEGEAERWLSDIIQANHEYFEGTVEFARTEPWDLLVLYVSSFDVASHALAGMIDPAASTFRPDLARRVWPHLEAIFRHTVDGFLERLRARFPGAAIVVAADHGIEGTGRRLYPNVALRQAGLLRTDRQGRIDLAGTEAMMAPGKGHMIFVNTTDWKGGIVPPGRRDEVKRRAAGVLLGLRDPLTGGPAIRAVLDVATDGDALGVGGERAGDLLFDPSPDLSPDAGAEGEDVIRSDTPAGGGSHGMWPTRRKLHAILYLVGPGVAAGRRLGTVQAADVAPTVASLLGIPPPAQTTGRSLLPGAR